MKLFLIPLSCLPSALIFLKCLACTLFCAFLPNGQGYSNEVFALTRLFVSFYLKMDE